MCGTDFGVLGKYVDLIHHLKKMFPPGIEPGTFRVLGGCDNHYTTETWQQGYWNSLDCPFG